jgi:predicted protein tyrosine phosphatase
MKKIYALSYHRFVETLSCRNIDDSNVFKQNTAFIQIGDIDREAKEDYEFTLKDAENVIGLRFDDCDEEIRIKILGTDEYEVREPMSEEQAQILYNFIEANKDKETFLVHCRAGQSRSGGVVSFLGEYFNIPEREIRWMSPRIHPNRRIVNILNKIHYKDIPPPPEPPEDRLLQEGKEPPKPKEK